MEKWYDVIEPHQDIKDGKLDEAVFAADLGDVISGIAPPEYKDPFLFARKTYFTDGIKNLLLKVKSILTEGKGSSVIEIRTPFGGGKTHSLIAIYHYIRNGNKIKKFLPKECEPIVADIAVIVGTHLNPLEGNEREALKIQTLWGEIAYQLGGKEGYLEFQENDKKRISPGKEKLKKFLMEKQPFILLLDEVLQYIAKANGVSYSKTNLGSQTFAFFQEITEAVASIPKGSMIVTLPSSVLEDYTVSGEESLRKLNKIFGRIESIETPVKGEEIYSVINKKLFIEAKDEHKKKEIVHDYFELYQNHKDELPRKVRDIDFKRRMELSYPFHPEIIDTLFERWGTYSSFQRTRGVLRLLAKILEDLYKNERNIQLILPSDINLDNSFVRQEFLTHIGSEHESVLSSDISGHDAKAIEFDKENKGWNHLAERVSTAIFFYSFSAQPEKGITLEELKLATIHQVTIPAMVTEVLHKLKDSLWYLNDKSGMFYFSKIPNLNRMVLDKKILYEDTYRDKLQTIIEKEIGKSFSSYLWPSKSEDVPDSKDLKLIVLDLSETIETAKNWINKRGTTFRTYKNTLIFAIPNSSGVGILKDQVQTFLALNEIKTDIKSNKEKVLEEKLPDIENRLRLIEDDYSFNVRKAYSIIFFGNKEYQLGQPKVGKESLSNWYKAEMLNKEKIVKNLHYRIIVNKFLADRTEIQTKLIIDQFYKDTSFFVPESESVIKKAIQLGIKDGAIGIGFKKEGKIEKESFKFRSNVSPSTITFDEDEVLFSRTKAEEIEKSLIEDPVVPTTEPVSSTTDPVVSTTDPVVSTTDPVVSTTDPVVSTTDPVVPTTDPTRIKKLFLRIDNIDSKNIAEINSGVILPLVKEIGSFKFAIEVDVEHSEGISISTLQNKVKETILQIGAKIVKEETNNR
jgi:predicted AAA+ superfamily ATPase